MKISTTEVQNAFGKYLGLVMDQQEIIITKNGKGVAKLVPYQDAYNLVRESEPYLLAHKITYEEYQQIVENSEQRYELIDGEIYLMASPLFNHQIAVNEVFGHFYNWFKGKKCRPLTSPFDVKLYNLAKCFEDDPNVVQPDILVMCDEDKVTKAGKYEGTPSLVVEVLSKSSRSKDMIKKLNLYMQTGVKEYWMIDTEKKRVYLYYFEERDISAFNVFIDNMTVQSVLFEGLEIKLKDIFAW